MPVSYTHLLSGKEPWNYGWEAEMTAERYLRLRHELIPYLYSMNYRTHKFGRALCEPLYYDNPECEGAYKCRNGYMFGSELLVCPVTSKINKKTRRADVYKRQLIVPRVKVPYRSRPL